MKREDHLQFDAYTKGILDPVAHSAFEERLQNDQELSEAFARYLQTRQIIRSYGLMEELKAIHGDYGQGRKKSHSIRIFPHLSLIAIGIVLLGFFLWFGREDEDPDQVASYYFIPYTDVITNRGASLDEAMLNYSNESYEQAFDLLKNQKSVSDTSLLYLINCSLALNGLEIPSTWSSMISAYAAESVFNQQIRWYGSLFYINNNKIQQGLNLLEKIQPGEFMYSEARELQRKLTSGLQ